MSGKDVCLACPTGVIACSKPFEDGCWILGKFCTQICAWFYAVKIEQAECSKAGDRDKVLNFIARNEDPEMRQKAFAQFDLRLARMVGGPLLRDAAWRNNAEKIIAICQQPGFGVSRHCMAGPLGETALHLACRGNLEATNRQDKK